VDGLSISILISLAALGISIYGVFEKRSSARRAERLRLISLTDNLGELIGELIDKAKSGEVMGDTIENLNSRIELTAQQALSLIQKHTLDVTGAELRTVAQALEESGLNEDAQQVWELAVDSRPKGDVQWVYAQRGYAYFH
jgi:hypothetical protein